LCGVFFFVWFFGGSGKLPTSSSKQTSEYPSEAPTQSSKKPNKKDQKRRPTTEKNSQLFSTGQGFIGIKNTV
jgi:hypothetical protein